MIANTFVIGAMKAATTSLCEYLDQHPNVCVARPKEPDFFSRDEVYSKGMGWYEKQFSIDGETTVCVDGSTSYTKALQYPICAGRIAKHVPDAKLIYIVRHPVERMASHWKHEVLKGRTQLDVDEFVRTQPEVVDISCYWRQLQEYRGTFSDNHILLLFLEDLRDNPKETVNRCCEFLGLNSMETFQIGENSNQSSKRQLDVWPIRVLRKYRWFDVGFERVKQKVPTELHTSLKKLLKSDKQVGSSELTLETIQWAETKLGDDPFRFLEHSGKPRDYWNFESNSVATVTNRE